LDWGRLFLFGSFFLAGFECATGYNIHRQWVDQVAATQHDRFADEDYWRLREVGIRAAREGVRWPLVDSRGKYDFSSVRPFLEAGRRHGVEIIYDLFHFGYPEDVDLLSASLPGRFADYCYSVAKFIAANSDSQGYFTPVNEPSYFSWAAGEVGLFAPHLYGRGWELKVNLVRAAVEGINAIWAACPGASIINVDPICRVAAPTGRPDLQQDADWFNDNAVFQSFDMLSGRLLPELGGSPRHLGVVGINYYWTNQWDVSMPGHPLADGDPRLLPLRDLVRLVWERYGTEIMITETSHVGERRAAWLGDVTREAEALIESGVPLKGICIYPVLGMPEWHSQGEWAQMGLWDLMPGEDALIRTCYEPMLKALGEAQDRLESRFEQGKARLTGNVKSSRAKAY
jgi:hypothetical protein